MRAPILALIAACWCFLGSGLCAGQALAGPPAPGSLSFSGLRSEHVERLAQARKSGKLALHREARRVSEPAPELRSHHTTPAKVSAERHSTYAPRRHAAFQLHLSISGSGPQCSNEGLVLLSLLRKAGDPVAPAALQLPAAGGLVFSLTTPVAAARDQYPAHIYAPPEPAA